LQKKYCLTYPDTAEYTRFQEIKIRARSLSLVKFDSLLDLSVFELASVVSAYYLLEKKQKYLDKRMVDIAATVNIS
jgi:hypothetical protein